MMGFGAIAGTVKTAIAARVESVFALWFTHQHVAMSFDHPRERLSYESKTTPYFLFGLLQIIVVGEPSDSMVEALGRKAD